MERESIEMDVLFVGAGPASLSGALHLSRLVGEHNEAVEKGTRKGKPLGEIQIAVIEKGSAVGSHILSGAVMDPKGIDELIPNWRDLNSPLTVPVTKNEHWVLSERKKYSLPHIFMPPFMSNKGTYTASLGNVCRWLAGQAEALGVEIFPGFAAAEVLFHEDGSVKGVATGDMGVARDGTRKPDYQPGMELHGRYTFFAEGARGHLTKEVKRIFEQTEEDSIQLNLYVVGYEDDMEEDAGEQEHASAAGGQLPEERSPNK